MGVAVILTPQAIEDLGAIVRHIAQDSPVRARQMGNELIDLALSLRTFPLRGRKVPELDDDSVRELIHGAYRIIYEKSAQTEVIHILRFWHAARGAPEK